MINIVILVLCFWIQSSHFWSKEWKFEKKKEILKLQDFFFQNEFLELKSSIVTQNKEYWVCGLFMLPTSIKIGRCLHSFLRHSAGPEILKMHCVKSKILKLINKNLIRFYLLIYLVSYCVPWRLQVEDLSVF